MKLTATTFCLVVALICFVLAAAHFRSGLVERVDWMNLGFAFVVASWIVA